MLMEIFCNIIHIKCILIIQAKARTIFSLENITKSLSCDQVFKEYMDKNERKGSETWSGIQ